MRQYKVISKITLENKLLSTCFISHIPSEKILITFLNLADKLSFDMRNEEIASLSSSNMKRSPGERNKRCLFPFIQLWSVLHVPANCYSKAIRIVSVPYSFYSFSTMNLVEWALNLTLELIFLRRSWNVKRHSWYCISGFPLVIIENILRGPLHQQRKSALENFCS